MNVARNATVLGVMMILAALAQAGTSMFDGDSATTVDLGTLSAAILGGLALIFGEKFSLSAILGKSSKTTTTTTRPTASGE